MMSADAVATRATITLEQRDKMDAELRALILSNALGGWNIIKASKFLTRKLGFYVNENVLANHMHNLGLDWDNRSGKRVDYRTEYAARQPASTGQPNLTPQVFEEQLAAPPPVATPVPIQLPLGTDNPMEAIVSVLHKTYNTFSKHNAESEYLLMHIHQDLAGIQQGLTAITEQLTALATLGATLVAANKPAAASAAASAP